VMNTGNQLSWNYSLPPNGQKNIYVSFLMLTTAVGGQVLSDTIIAEPVAGDSTPFNNIYFLTDTVMASLDPNDKAVFPAGPVSSGYVTSDTNYLDYTVRFQNTGTDTAFNIIITDTLSEHLNLASLQVLSSSHDYNVQLRNNIVQWSFNDILLPDSNVNEPLSHGYVRYRIKPLPTLTAGTEIKNKAAIYFDYNEAVITNQTITPVINILPVTLVAFNVHHIGCAKVQLAWSTSSESHNAYFTVERSVNGQEWKALAIINGSGNSHVVNDYSYTDYTAVTGTVYYRLKQTDADGKSSYSFLRSVNCSTNNFFVKVYPNPLQEVLYINTSSTSFKYVLYDGRGVVLTQKSINGNTASVSTAMLSKGVYFIRLITADGNSIHRLVKE
jgi:hypothetical protein